VWSRSTERRWPAGTSVHRFRCAREAAPTGAAFSLEFTCAPLDSCAKVARLVPESLRESPHLTRSPSR
jgi:hypothetical protein